MYLSKSKYCKGIQCPKILWLEKNKKEYMINQTNEQVFENGDEVGELAKSLFGEHINIEFNENLNQMIEDTKEALKKENAIITEASFTYKNNFCSVDVLKKINDEYEIYEVKSSTSVHDIYKDDASYQTYILLNLGYKVKKVSIVHINSDYERIGELELNKFFKITDITEEALKKQEEIKNNIEKICEYVENDVEQNEEIDEKCFKPYPCPFFKYCTKEALEPNIFNVRRITTKEKIKWYKEGYKTFNELLNSNIKDIALEQIKFEINNLQPKINKEKIKEFLKALEYPLYFLDFETFQQPIPKYNHVKPFMQIPFQYSLHYKLDENGNLEHKEFLAEANKDPRRKLAEQLIKDIPENVCVIAYNMMFEKMVIKNLANLYEDLKEHLMNIYDNMYDLMIPFKDRNYYTKEMEGSYSIKYVLPALFPNDESLNYHNLDMIHNGEEAMNMYANLEKYNKEEQQKIRECLLKYCELDTLAMVKIYEKLIETIK